MHFLSAPPDGAAQKFTDRGITDIEDLRDFAVAESFSPEVETNLLLPGESANYLLQPGQPFLVDHLLFGIFLRVRKNCLQRFEGDQTGFAGTDRGAVIMRDAKNPRARIVDALAPAKDDVEAEKYLLRGVLRLPRRQTEEEKIAINVIARLLEETRDRFLGTRGYGFVPDSLGITLQETKGHFQFASTQMAAPLNDWPLALTLTVRFDETGSPQLGVPAGGAGTAKLI